MLDQLFGNRKLISMYPKVQVINGKQYVMVLQTDEGDICVPRENMGQSAPGLVFISRWEQIKANPSLSKEGNHVNPMTGCAVDPELDKAFTEKHTKAAKEEKASQAFLNAIAHNNGEYPYPDIDSEAFRKAKAEVLEDLAKGE